MAVFLEAWRAEEITYIDQPFVLRTAFTRRRTLTADDALRASLPGALAWLNGREGREVPPGSLGGADGLARLAEAGERIGNQLR